MTRGLVIGKFMPVHNGHLALIDFASGQCDELIVSMSYGPEDPIDPQTRFGWLKEIFAGSTHILPAMIPDDFDDESLALPERTRIWSQVMKEHFPPIDLIFSSEQYGDDFAANLQAKHIAFDPYRKKFPVSATKIRARPFRYWDQIPPVVQPYFVKKICFYGPESTGKTTMAKRMAEICETSYVPESARSILRSNDFTLSDIIHIGQTLDNWNELLSTSANKVLFCDTDFITTQIYSGWYLNTIPDKLLEWERKTNYALYFLMDIDTPWVADHLRDQPEKRGDMMELFKGALETRKIPFILISGEYPEREARVIREVNALIEKY